MSAYDFSEYLSLDLESPNEDVLKRLDELTGNQSSEVESSFKSAAEFVLEDSNNSLSNASAGKIKRLLKKYSALKKDYIVNFPLPISLRKSLDFSGEAYNLKDALIELKFELGKDGKSIPTLEYKLRDVDSGSFISKIDRMRFDLEVIVSLSAQLGIFRFNPYATLSPRSIVEFFDIKNKMKNILYESLDFQIYASDLFSFLEKVEFDAPVIEKNATDNDLLFEEWLKKNIEAFKRCFQVLYSSGGDKEKSCLKLAIRRLLKFSLAEPEDKAIHICTILEILYGKEKSSGKLKEMAQRIAESIACTYKEFGKIINIFGDVEKIRNNYVHEGYVDYVKLGEKIHNEKVKCIISCESRLLSPAARYISKYIFKRLGLFGNIGYVIDQYGILLGN